MFLSIRWTAFCILVGALAIGTIPVKQSSAEGNAGVCFSDAMEAEEVLALFIVVDRGRSNVSNYLTSSSDNEYGLVPLTLNAANSWMNQYDSLVQ